MVVDSVVALSLVYGSVWRYTKSTIYAGHAIAWFHVLVTVINGLRIYNNKTEAAQTTNDIFEQSTFFTLTYFTFDTVQIACTNLKHDWIFIPHHIIAIIMGVHALLHNIPQPLMIMYMFFIELSNICLSPYMVTKNKTIKKYMFYLLALTYIPIRLFYLPWLSYYIIQSVDILYINCCFILIACMSIGYSIKLLHRFFTYK